MHRPVALTLLGLLVVPWGADALSKPKPHGTKRAASRTYARARGRSGKGRRGTRTAPAPSYQLHPDPERYQQIQTALAERGYFKGEANGAWGDDSAGALKHFQADRKLDDDGKITARSLIALGLGPKHDGSTGTAAPLAATPPPTTPPTSAPAAEMPASPN